MENVELVLEIVVARLVDVLYSELNLGRLNSKTTFVSGGGSVCTICSGSSIAAEQTFRVSQVRSHAANYLRAFLAIWDRPIVL